MWLGVSRGAERTEYKEEERIITKLDTPALDWQHWSVVNRRNAVGLLWPHLCCISLRKEKHRHYLLRVPCLIFLHYPVPILQYITYSLVDHLSLSLKGKLARTWILVGPSCFPQRMESPNIFLMKNEQMGKNKQKFTKTGGLLLKRDTLKTEGFRKLESEMAILLNW